MIFPIFNSFNNPIYVDLHSHLLPDIDDGVKSIKESLTIIKKFQELGYKKLITTPHIMSHRYPNTKDIILKKLELLQKYIENENLNIKIVASAEYYLDNTFLEQIKTNTLLPFNNKYILFETTYQSEPINLFEVIFEMQSKGYIPVLAHPERYFYLHESLEKYHELKELGVLFQVNVKSLKNQNHSISKMGLKLINLGLVDFMGSDIHKTSEMKHFEKLLTSRMYENIFKKNTILNNTLN